MGTITNAAQHHADESSHSGVAFAGGGERRDNVREIVGGRHQDRRFDGALVRSQAANPDQRTRSMGHDVAGSNSETENMMAREVGEYRDGHLELEALLRKSGPILETAVLPAVKLNAPFFVQVGGEF